MNRRAFTLVEILVAGGVFVLLMAVAGGALFTSGRTSTRGIEKMDEISRIARLGEHLKKVLRFAVKVEYELLPGDVEEVRVRFVESVSPADGTRTEKPATFKLRGAAGGPRKLEIDIAGRTQTMEFERLQLTLGVAGNLVTVLLDGGHGRKLEVSIASPYMVATNALAANPLDGEAAAGGPPSGGPPLGSGGVEGPPPAGGVMGPLASAGPPAMPGGPLPGDAGPGFEGSTPAVGREGVGSPAGTPGKDPQLVVRGTPIAAGPGQERGPARPEAVGALGQGPIEGISGGPDPLRSMPGDGSPEEPAVEIVDEQGAVVLGAQPGSRPVKGPVRLQPTLTPPGTIEPPPPKAGEKLETPESGSAPRTLLETGFGPPAASRVRGTPPPLSAPDTEVLRLFGTKPPEPDAKPDLPANPELAGKPPRPDKPDVRARPDKDRDRPRRRSEALGTLPRGEGMDRPFGP